MAETLLLLLKIFVVFATAGSLLELGIIVQASLSVPLARWLGKRA